MSAAIRFAESIAYCVDCGTSFSICAKCSTSVKFLASARTCDRSATSSAITKDAGSDLPGGLFPRADHVADTGDDRVGAVGLGKVVDCAKLNRTAPEFGFRVAREQQDLDVEQFGVRLDEAGQFQPIDLGHHEIRQHQIHVGIPDDLQCRGAIFGGYDFIAGRGQPKLEAPRSHLVRRQR